MVTTNKMTGLAIWLTRGIAVAFVAVAVVNVGSLHSQPTGGASSEMPPRALLDQYCVGCHNDRLKTAGFTLAAAEAQKISQNPAVWEKVVRKLRARSMPPTGLPRPSENIYAGTVASLENTLDRLAAAKRDPGRTDTFRRLNRTEYHNAIRDLLDLDIDVSSMLPGDDSSHGFDNVTVGELSPTLLERYLAAARKISRLAVGGAVRAPGGDTIALPPDLTQEQHFDELPFGTRGGTVVHYNFPLDAEYEIQLRLARDRNEHVEGLNAAHQIELTLDGERAQTFTVQPPRRGGDHADVDKELHLRLPVKAGPHDLAATFLKKASVLLETERQPYQAHFNADRHPRQQPALYSISVTGPFNASGPGDTPSRQRIFVCHPAKPSEQDACAGKILSRLSRHAWRRPVTDADLQAPMRFYREGRDQAGFENGIEMALRVLLTSPRFLFRVEQDPSGVASNTAYSMNDIDLASRLSFFLWSSIPDDELLNAAIHGTLKQPPVLEKQVRRMLADNRSEALVNNFAEQWLYLRNLAIVSPDARLFPDFDDNLRQAFRRETEMFFESVMREDRNVLDLLRANYTFVNERLARHYGIPNVYGSRFRRVTFDDGIRGGLLSQGSVLTVTSYATRTSPVLRGKWVLANILGAPPPPAPPNVPVLKETAELGKNLTMRERMAEHRANPACAGCHKLMDPVGFALENYDAVGRWRTADNGVTMDVAGGLPDGSSFQGVSGLRDALLQRPELFVTTTTEKLLTYALGRGVEECDAPAVREIVRNAQKNDYRFSSLVLGIVKSTPFQMRRSQ